ncbi:hypothetical protein JW964_14845 [candidate division KSB1 bacterium]|nr:hypothetical protein [candidate division KSB1 bacterium]
MTIFQLKNKIVEISAKFGFIKTILLLDETESALKIRLEIDKLIFIQIYQNIATGTVNYQLIYNSMRIYARDSIGGKWHLHPFKNPALHEFSTESSKPISLYEFLQEVEMLLIDEKLI